MKKNLTLQNLEKKGLIKREAKRKVLIVDNQKDILVTMKNIAEREGYEATTEQDARKAVVIAGKTKFDLVILDVMMPDMNGEEAAELMKKDAKGRPKIIFCTIVPKDEIEKMFLVDGFIQKPFEYRKFAGELKRVLGEGK